jgi:hypothetical protein
MAYEVGTADVMYGYLPSACCRGLEACGGEFVSAISDKQYVEVGEIPIGKTDLTIVLDSGADVDVQLYDMETGQVSSVPHRVPHRVQHRDPHRDSHRVPHRESHIVPHIVSQSPA